MSSIIGDAWAAVKEKRMARRATDEARRRWQEAEFRRVFGSKDSKQVRDGARIAFGCQALDLPDVREEFRREEFIHLDFYLDYLECNEDSVIRYVASVEPVNGVPESNVYIGLHWAHDDDTYGGWVCDKQPIYNGFGCLEAAYSLKDVAKLELPKTGGIKLFPVVYYSSDGVFDHASFKTTLEDAINHDLLLAPDKGIIEYLRIEWAKAKAEGKESEYDSEMGAKNAPNATSNKDDRASDMAEYALMAIIFVGVAAFMSLGVIGVVVWILLLVSGGIGAAIAELKRKDAFWIGFWMSLFVPVVGWVIACILPRRERGTEVNQASNSVAAS